ncbi:MAG: alpha/beta hydrolase [Woeseiaceae bacterium]
MRILTVLFSCLCISGVAAAETVSINGLHGLDESRYHRIESEEIGRGYHVVVGLPAGYDESGDTTYPTIYILDGGVLYPLLKGYYNYLRHSEEAPAAILVAISYGASDFADGNMRSNDYTAPTDEREFWGGAEAFQSFLQNDLIPFIEKEYRSAPAQRVIFGQSIGGQFVLFTAQTQPDLFWGHIASNPALHRNLPFFLELHADAGSSSGQSRLYVGSGSHDDPTFRVPALEWIEHWTNQPDLPWALRAETLQSHTHFSIPPASFRQGLKWIFEH